MFSSFFCCKKSKINLEILDEDYGRYVMACLNESDPDRKHYLAEISEKILAARLIEEELEKRIRSQKNHFHLLNYISYKIHTILLTYPCC